MSRWPGRPQGGAGTCSIVPTATLSPHRVTAALNASPILHTAAGPSASVHSYQSRTLFNSMSVDDQSNRAALIISPETSKRSSAPSAGRNGLFCWY